MNPNISHTQAEEDLALKLFDIGAVQFGEFKLKLHEKNPDAPLSPIFFNFRTPDNPKPGPLTDEVLDLVGKVVDSSWRREDTVSSRSINSPICWAISCSQD